MKRRQRRHDSGPMHTAARPTTQRVAAAAASARAPPGARCTTTPSALVTSRACVGVRFMPSSSYRGEALLAKGGDGRWRCSARSATPYGHAAMCRDRLAAQHRTDVMPPHSTTTRRAHSSRFDLLALRCAQHTQTSAHSSTALAQCHSGAPVDQRAGSIGGNPTATAAQHRHRRRIGPWTQHTVDESRCAHALRGSTLRGEVWRSTVDRCSAADWCVS